MKKTIISTIIIFFIILLCSVSLVYTPQKMLSYKYNSNDLIAEIYPDRYSKNAVTVPGSDDTFFIRIDKNTKYIVLRLSEPLNSPQLIRAYFNTGKGYSEDEKQSLICPIGEKYIYYTLPENTRSVSFRSSMQFTIEAIEVHYNPHQEVISSIPANKIHIVLALVISLLLSALFYNLDKKYDMSSNILCIAKSNFIYIKNNIIFIIGTVVIAIISELIMSKVLIPLMGKPDNSYNMQRAFAIFTLIFLAFFIISCRHIIKQKLEKIVFVIILTIGVTIIICSPLAHTGWDVDTHYNMALRDSYIISDTQLTVTDMDIITARYDSLVKFTKEENLRYKDLTNKKYKYVMASRPASGAEFSIAHLPAGIAMATTRALGFPFQIVYYSAEFANLLIYALLCYFAIKKLKYGKMILTVIALFPTNLFIASNINYDYWVLGLSFLGFAWFFGTCQEQEDTISIKDTLIMNISLAFSCIPKQIYIPFLVVPFLMPPKKIKKKKLYYLTSAITIILIMSSLLIRSNTEISGAGDVRGGETGPIDQISYMLSAPVKAATTILRYYKDYISIPNMGSYISNFAHLSPEGPYRFAVGTFIAIIIFVIITDRADKEYDIVPKITRLYMVLMYLATSGLIVLAFYLVFTPVGKDTVIGCQGRYLTPLLYPAVAMSFGTNCKYTGNPALYRIVVIAIYIALIYLRVFRVILPWVT